MCGGGEHIAPDHYRYMENHNEFDVGDHVVIEDGGFVDAYAGKELKVLDIKQDQAVLKLALFGEEVKVPVPVGHLRKAG